MHKNILLASIVFSLFAGCVVHEHGAPKASPGQVQKSTGYNPASGKCHPKGGPPGQTKKHGGCFGRTSDSCECTD